MLQTITRYQIAFFDKKQVLLYLQNQPSNAKPKFLLRNVGMSINPAQAQNFCVALEAALKKTSGEITIEGLRKALRTIEAANSSQISSAINDPAKLLLIIAQLYQTASTDNNIQFMPDTKDRLKSLGKKICESRGLLKKSNFQTRRILQQTLFKLEMAKAPKTRAYLSTFTNAVVSTTTAAATSSQKSISRNTPPLHERGR